MTQKQVNYVHQSIFFFIILVGSFTSYKPKHSGASNKCISSSVRNPSNKRPIVGCIYDLEGTEVDVAPDLLAIPRGGAGVDIKEDERPRLHELRDVRASRHLNNEDPFNLAEPRPEFEIRRCTRSVGESVDEDLVLDEGGITATRFGAGGRDARVNAIAAL